MATRSRFGDLYNATVRTKQQLFGLQRQIQKKLNNLTNEYVREKLAPHFEQVMESLNAAMLEHEIYLNVLIDKILFGKQGLMYPRISPRHITENSKLIKEQIPYAEFPIPINERGMDQLTRISNLHNVF